MKMVNHKNVSGQTQWYKKLMVNARDMLDFMFSNALIRDF